MASTPYGIRCQFDDRQYYLSLWDLEARTTDLVALDEDTAQQFACLLERALNGEWHAVRGPRTQLRKARKNWRRAPGDEG